MTPTKKNDECDYVVDVEDVGDIDAVEFRELMKFAIERYPGAFQKVKVSASEAKEHPELAIAKKLLQENRTRRKGSWTTWAQH